MTSMYFLHEFKKNNDMQKLLAVTVLAAAFVWFAPMPSRAADYALDARDDLRSGSRSKSLQCSTAELPLLTSCAITLMDEPAQTTSLMQKGGGGYRGGPEQIDATTALLEDLMNTGGGLF